MINDDDRDYDGIPDKFDSTFNTPQEVMEKKGIITDPRSISVNQDELERLAKSDIPFIACNDDGKYKVIVDESNVDDTLKAIRQPQQRRMSR